MGYANSAQEVGVDQSVGQGVCKFIRPDTEACLTPVPTLGVSDPDGSRRAAAAEAVHT